MKIHRNPIEEAFTAKSKASGKVVNFASQQNRDNAIKSGEYEETDDAGEEPAAAKPKVNIFDKPKPQAQPAADTDGDSKPSSMVAPPVVKTPVDVLKSKVEKWSEKEKAFFRDGIHKEDSPERRNWKDAIKDKAKGALAAIKKGAKHEVEEFKAAGAGVKNFFSGKELSEHEKKALKSVAIKVATTAIFGAVTGGAGHGVLAFGKHVAMEFIPHVVGETILKGAGTAALFAGDEEEDVYMERFMAIIADKMANEKITPELMTQMVDSYNAKKGEGDSVNEETYKVAGRPVVLIKGKNSNGTDWKVKFQNGKETSLSDVIALIKPFPKDIKESELKGYLAADVVDDIVKTIGSKMVKGHVENAPNKNYIYLKLTDIKFGNDVVKMLKSKFGIDSKIDKTFGNIPTISFPSKKVVSEGKSINEFMMPRDVDSKMKELGINKIPISSQGEKVLQGMVKEKFLDKVTNTERLIYFVESLGNEKFGYRSKGKPLSSLVDRFWNDITSEAIFFGGKMAAYQVAMNIKDMKRNGEQLDSPYQMMKEYFKNFGMEHDRSRVFDSAIRNLEEWMKRNKIQESVNEGRGIKSIQKDLDKTITAIESEIASYKETKGTPQEKKHIDNLKKLHPIKKKLEAELDGVVSGLYRDAELKIEEGAITEKQFKGLEGIPSTTSLEKISKDQKLKIIKAPGNIIDFIVPKGVNRNFWQVIGTGKIQKNLGGNYVLLGKVIHSPAFKSMDDLIDGVNWKSMEDRRRFNESVNEAKEIKWQDVEVGDVANVKAINKTGLIIKTYGRKFHLKFPNGSTKTYDADELTFIKN